MKYGTIDILLLTDVKVFFFLCIFVRNIKI